ncbi:MAG: hypothetical protein ACYDBV_13425 [Nitrospiria bacterium]
MKNQLSIETGQPKFRADKYLTKQTGRSENDTPLFSKEPDQIPMFGNSQKCANCGHTYLTDPEDTFLRVNHICAECEAIKCKS